MSPLNPVLMPALASFPWCDAQLLAYLSSAVNWELLEPSSGLGTSEVCKLGGLPLWGAVSLFEEVSIDPQNDHSEL